MEIRKITAAAIFSKRNIHVKIWFEPSPLQPTDNDSLIVKEKYNEWFNSGKIYEFKDDLQAGKFMWLASYVFNKACSMACLNNVHTSYFDSLTKSGVFISNEHLQLIGFENDKIYLKSRPKLEPEIDIPISTQTVSPEEKFFITKKRLREVIYHSLMSGFIIGVAVVVIVIEFINK